MPSNCNHDKDLLLAAAEGRLSADEMTKLSPVLDSCPECRADFASFRTLHLAAASWDDVPVPKWRRESAMPRHERPAFAWTNWVSLGASFAALALVAFKVDVASTSDGWHVSFGGQSPATTVASTDIDRKLKDFELRQSALLEARLADQDDAARDTTRTLLKAVADQNRRERREDLETLLTYWQAQRVNDKQHLEQKVESVSSQQERNKRALQNLLRSINDTETVTKTESL